MAGRVRRDGRERRSPTHPVETRLAGPSTAVSSMIQSLPATAQPTSRSDQGSRSGALRAPVQHQTPGRARTVRHHARRARPAPGSRRICGWTTTTGDPFSYIRRRSGRRRALAGAVRTASTDSSLSPSKLVAGAAMLVDHTRSFAATPAIVSTGDVALSTWSVTRSSSARTSPCVSTTLT